MISSHILDELGKIATNYGIMSDGVLVEEITAEELVEKCRTSLKITVDNVEAAKNIITINHPEFKMEAFGNTVSIISDVKDNSVLVEELVRENIRIYEVKNESKGIEDFFIERMGN